MLQFLRNFIDEFCISWVEGQALIHEETRQRPIIFVLPAA
jgi:hypothetical protein